MKHIKKHFVFAAYLCILLSCSKPEEDVETCEDKGSTMVTFSNTGTTALRVVVSGSLTPQYEPVNPLFSIDLAPGQSVEKEFRAGRYVNTWYNGCPAACNRMANNFKDYEQCKTYEEKR